MRILIVSSNVTDYDRPWPKSPQVTSPLTSSESAVDNALHDLRDASFGVLTSLEHAAANIVAVLPLLRQIRNTERIDGRPGDLKYDLGDATIRVLAMVEWYFDASFDPGLDLQWFVDLVERASDEILQRTRYFAISFDEGLYSAPPVLTRMMSTMGDITAILCNLADCVTCVRWGLLKGVGYPVPVLSFPKEEGGC